MRRVVSVIIATVGSLALLATFHTTSGTAHRSALGVTPPTRPPAGGSPPTGGSTSPTSPAPSSTTPASTTPATRTVDGPVVSNRYGDVQVRIRVSGGQLVDVQALQLPFDRHRSQEISDFAGPELRQEALQAHSANIDVVSGATYTSESYAQSLQAALDQVGA